MSARERGKPAANSRIRVYLGDAALTEPLADKAVAELVEGEAGSVDLEVVRLPDDSVHRVESALRQVGMFSPGRCVFLRGSLEETDDLEFLFAFLSKGIAAESALVIAAPKIDGRSRLFRWLTENAAVEDLRFERKSDGSRTFDPQEIEDFVRLRVAAAGCRAVDERAVVAIAERAGSDLGELGNEIDRICLTLAEGAKLTESHVAAAMRDMGAAWVFGFTDALFERRAADALRVVSELLEQGDPPIRIVATVASRVAEILAAAEYARTEGISTIPSHSGTFVKSVYPTLSAAAKRRFNRPYAAYHAFRQGQQRGVKALRTMHRRLLDLDIALKSGGGEARHLFSAFVTSTCAPRS